MNGVEPRITDNSHTKDGREVSSIGSGTLAKPCPLAPLPPLATSWVSQTISPITLENDSDQGSPVLRLGL